MDTIEWQVKHFNKLSLIELYQILALRSEVFVVEQDCVYQDIDGKDLDGFHVIGVIDNKIIATARILKKGVSYQNEISIGRVVTSPSIRTLKKGHELMETCMRFIETEFPSESIKISAQSHLESYYAKHGFKATGKTYLEDGIPHSEMIIEK